MTHIVRAKVENIMGAREVEIAPNGQPVTIGGKNGQGKSSTIRALAMALAGRGEIPEMPVTAGAEQGRVTIELDEFNVTLEVGADRKTKLRVEAKDGSRFSSPQTILDRLFGHLSFDPGAFKSMDAKRRAETLRNLVGLDFSQLDFEYQRKYEERRDWNREVKRLEAQFEGAPKHADVGEEEISSQTILAELDKANAINSEKERLEAKVGAVANARGAQIQRVEELAEQLRQAQIRLDELGREYAQVVEAHNAAPIVDTEPLKQQLDQLEETNRKARDNRKRREIEAELNQAQARAREADGRIKAIEQEKREKLAAAAFPVPGLSFEDGDVTLGGIPFDQLSESQQWQIATAIAFALNPKGIVFMRQSGGLDKDSREAVRKRAAECGVQLFLEVVDDADDVTVLIEEGTVKANRLEPSLEQAAVSSRRGGGD